MKKCRHKCFDGVATRLGRCSSSSCGWAVMVQQVAQCIMDVCWLMFRVKDSVTSLCSVYSIKLLKILSARAVVRMQFAVCVIVCAFLHLFSPSRVLWCCCTNYSTNEILLDTLHVHHCQCLIGQ